MEIKKYIEKLFNNQNLTLDESQRTFELIFSNVVTPAQISAIITALSIKIPTAEEIAGAVLGIRSCYIHPLKNFHDATSLRSSGNIQNKLPNISLISSIILNKLGLTIVDHGKFSITDNGTYNILKKWGYNFNCSYQNSISNLTKNKFCFFDENLYIKTPVDLTYVRLEIGARNFLDYIIPFLSPIKITHQIMGTTEPKNIPSLISAAKILEIKSFYVISNDLKYDKIVPNIDNIIQGYNINGINFFDKIKPINNDFSYSQISKYITHNDRNIFNLSNNNVNIYKYLVLMNLSYYIKLLNIEHDMDKAYYVAKGLLEKDNIMDIIRHIVEESNLNSCLI